MADAAARAADPDVLSCRELIERIEVLDDRVDIDLAISKLGPSTEVKLAPSNPHRISLPTVRPRRGKEIRLLIPATDGALQASPDPALIKLLANAFAARDAVDAAGTMTLAEVARAAGYSLEYFALILRLSMLASLTPGCRPPTIRCSRPSRATSATVFWVFPVTIGTAAFGEELIFREFVTDALRRPFGGSGLWCWSVR